MSKEIERIIILTNTLKNGGAEKQSIMLAHAMQSSYDTLLVVYYGDQVDEKLKRLVDEYNVEVVLLFGYHVKRIFKLIKIFRHNKKAVVFSYLATTNVLNAILGLVTGIYYRVGGIRNAEISHMKMIIQRFLNNYILTCSVFNNFQGRNALIKKGFKKSKTFVIHNSIDIKQSRKSEFSEKSLLRIITIGRFVKQKDYPTAIEAIEKLLELINSNEDPIRIEYVIVGYGELEKELRTLISLKGLDETIKLVINPKNINEYLFESDIYLSSSIFEGLSNSILEAMEYSLPIVATNVGDNDKLVYVSENGYLTTVGDSNAISQALYELVRNAELRNEMGKKSYINLVNNFTIEPFKKKYLNLISILENGS